MNKNSFFAKFAFNVMKLKRKLKMTLGGHTGPESFFLDYLENNGFQLSVFRYTGGSHTNFLIEFCDPIEQEILNRIGTKKCYEKRRKNPMYRFKRRLKDWLLSKDKEYQAWYKDWMNRRIEQGHGAE